MLTPLTIHSFLSTHQISQPANSGPGTGRKLGTHADGRAGQTNVDHAALDDVTAANMSVDEFVAMHDAHSYIDNNMGTTAMTLDTDQLFAVKTKNPASKFKKRLGAKAVKSFERDSLNAQGLLKPQAATTFRAISARGNYLGQDRADGSYSLKELCRDFSTTNDHSLQKLKRLGRYYKGKPRLVYKYPFATAPATEITVYRDTDFAGCSQTRRSLSGGCAMIGGSQIKHWSKTQSTIALSSGEAELIGIGSGCAQGLGLQSLAADMGWKLKLSVHSDATAALGIAKRRGLSKIRHLHCTDLWIQERVRNGDVALHKVLGTENPADIFTKYVDANLMEKALNKQNMFFMEGRAKLAPDTMGLGKQ